jgi:predicted DNA-binding transcriptional regulator AlpA
MAESQPSRSKLLRGDKIWSTRDKQGRLPISRQTWLNGVRDGYFPPPIQLGPGVVAWREEDIERIEREGTGRTVRRPQPVIPVILEPATEV